MGLKLFLYNGTIPFVKFKLELIDGNTEKLNKTKKLEEKNEGNCNCIHCYLIENYQVH